METLLQKHAPAPAAAPAWEPERVPVVRIKVCLDHERCAVLGEFHAADKVLGRWVDEGRAVNAFAFELVFMDGYRYCGSYRFRMRKGARPSLARFVRALFADDPARCAVEGNQGP